MPVSAWSAGSAVRQPSRRRLAYRRLSSIALLAGLSGAACMNRPGPIVRQAEAPIARNALRRQAGFQHELILVHDLRSSRIGVREAPSVRGVSSWISNVVQTAGPSRELLPSWNIRRREGEAWLIELRVGAAAGDAWSNWFSLDLLGDAEGRYASFWSMPDAQWGALCTDYWFGARDFDRFQFRVRRLCSCAKYDGAGGGADSIQRLAACCTVRRAAAVAPNVNVVGGAAGQTAALRRAPALDVPFLSQHVEQPDLQGNICSPTSVAMLLQFRGVAATPESVARAAFDPRHRIFGNWPRNVQAAFERGVPGYVRRFDRWNEVEALLAAGQPLIASIRDPNGELQGTPYPRTVGHLLVIRGFDAADNILVNDPAGRDAAHGRLTYDRAQFERAWLDNGGVAYVLEAP